MDETGIAASLDLDSAISVPGLFLMFFADDIVSSSSSAFPPRVLHLIRDNEQSLFMY